MLHVKFSRGWITAAKLGCKQRTERDMTRLKKSIYLSVNISLQFQSEQKLDFEDKEKSIRLRMLIALEKW